MLWQSENYVEIPKGHWLYPTPRIYNNITNTKMYTFQHILENNNDNKILLLLLSLRIHDYRNITYSSTSSTIDRNDMNNNRGNSTSVLCNFQSFWFNKEKRISFQYEFEIWSNTGKHIIKCITTYFINNKDVNDENHIELRAYWLNCLANGSDLYSNLHDITDIAKKEKWTKAVSKYINLK